MGRMGRFNVFAPSKPHRRLSRLIKNGLPLILLLPLAALLVSAPAVTGAQLQMTSDPDCVAWDNDYIDCFVRGNDNALWDTSWRGGTFRSWESLGAPSGGLNSGPTATSWYPDRLDIFARGEDNALWHISWQPSNGLFLGSWESWGGGITSDPDCVAWGANRIDCFARGEDNALWHISWRDGTLGSWESWGGGFTSGPAAASWSSGRLDVFARGEDNALWHIGWSGTLGSWESWGGGITSDPDCVSTGETAIECFARGEDNALWRISRDGGLGSWESWGAPSGGLSSGPTAASTEPGIYGSSRLDVFARGVDNALWHISWRSGTLGSWEPIPMTTSPTTAPTVTTTAIPPQAQFDFQISVTPPQQSVVPGGSITYTVNVNLVSGTPQSVLLSLSTLPAGVSTSLNPTSGTPSYSSTLTVTTTSSASPRTVTMAVLGNGGGVTHSATVTLSISQASDFSINVSPASLSALQGQTVSYSVNVAAMNGFNSQVALSVSGLPSGASGVFSVPAGAPNFASTLAVTIPLATPAGSYTLTVTGNGGGVSHVANLVLTVNPAPVATTSSTTTQTSPVATTSSTTTQTSAPQTPFPAGGDLMAMLQQNELPIIVGIILLLVAVLALRGRKKPEAPARKLKMPSI